MRALSIRQPFAELILRGTKRIEYRSRPTKIIGERFWIYASKSPSSVASGPLPVKGPIVGDNIALPDQPLPPWMIELAEGLRLWKPGELPTGVIVGSAVIEKCVAMEPTTDGGPRASTYLWHLTDVTRLAQVRKPLRHPQPAWFRPF